jgi:hypothetical protein
MTKNKITFNDLRDGVAVMKHYKMPVKEYERQVREHLRGMKQQDMRKEYQKIFKEQK